MSNLLRLGFIAFVCSSGALAFVVDEPITKIFEKKEKGKVVRVMLIGTDHIAPKAYFKKMVSIINKFADTPADTHFLRENNGRNKNILPLAQQSKFDIPFADEIADLEISDKAFIEYWLKNGKAWVKEAVSLDIYAPDDILRSDNSTRSLIVRGRDITPPNKNEIFQDLMTGLEESVEVHFADQGNTLANGFIRDLLTFGEISRDPFYRFLKSKFGKERLRRARDFFALDNRNEKAIQYLNSIVEKHPDEDHIQFVLPWGAEHISGLERLLKRAGYLPVDRQQDFNE